MKLIIINVIDKKSYLCKFDKKDLDSFARLRNAENKNEIHEKFKFATFYCPDNRKKFQFPDDNVPLIAQPAENKTS